MNYLATKEELVLGVASHPKGLKLRYRKMKGTTKKNKDREEYWVEAYNTTYFNGGWHLVAVAETYQSARKIGKLYRETVNKSNKTLERFIDDVADELKEDSIYPPFRGRWR